MKKSGNICNLETPWREGSGKAWPLRQWKVRGFFPKGLTSECSCSFSSCKDSWNGNPTSRWPSTNDSLTSVLCRFYPVLISQTWLQHFKLYCQCKVWYHLKKIYLQVSPLSVGRDLWPFLTITGHEAWGTMLRKLWTTFLFSKQIVRRVGRVELGDEPLCIATTRAEGI